MCRGEGSDERQEKRKEIGRMQELGTRSTGCVEARGAMRGN